MSKVAARPWGGEKGRLSNGVEVYQIWNEDGNYPQEIATLLNISKQDFDLIINAVNEYDMLKEEVRELSIEASDLENDLLRAKYRIEVLEGDGCKGCDDAGCSDCYGGPDI